MNAIIAAATSRSRTVIIALMVIIAAGIASYFSIPKESEPEIDIPFIYVEVALEGVSPEDAERLLVRPLEQEFRTIEGIKEMVASGGENRATVTLEFEADADVDKALTDVRERVDLAKSKGNIVAPQKVANMVAGVASGGIQPVEMIFQKA